MSNRQLNPDLIRQHVEALLRIHPELAEDDVLRADMIEGETQLFDLLRQLEVERREAVTFAGALVTIITEMEDRQGRYERREKALRELMHKLLDSASIRKLELPECTLSIRSCPPKVVITAADINELPEAYICIEKKPDKQAISAALKSGATVPGAALSNQPDTITIRTK